jgi:hypothetical protein
MKRLFKPRPVLSLATTFTLLLALTLSIAAFIPKGARVHAASAETLAVPFANGPNGATTTNSYSGSVTINVSGTGQASGTQCSDAFYIYTDFSNVQGTCGTPITPVHIAAFGLCINGQPVDTYVPTIPPYSSSHTYQFTISVGSSPQTITFGVCDTFTSDNTGSFTITVTPASSSPVQTALLKYLQHQLLIGVPLCNPLKGNGQGFIECISRFHLIYQFAQEGVISAPTFIIIPDFVGCIVHSDIAACQRLNQLVGGDAFNPITG